ncbi:MAG: DUF6230 family protein [Actinomadura sp.]
MPTSTDGTALGRVRWKRFAAVMAPAAVGAGALVFLTAQGAIAASFAVSGDSFKVAVDRLDGKGFVQYGGIDVSKDGVKHPVQVSAIREATIRGMCQSLLVKTPVGPLTVQLSAGNGDTPVTARNLVMDVESLSADAEFGNIEIGRDAGTLDKGPEGARGATGMFGQQADRVRLTNVQQTAWATTAGTFKLSGLKIGLKPGTHECF